MATNLVVELRGNESADRLIKRFLKKCKKQDVIREFLNKTSYFKSKSQKRKEKIVRNQFIRGKEKQKVYDY